MELPHSANGTRPRLQQVRETVLQLHKALLDSERTAYEITHGPVGSPAAFLQLLINDAAFAWLQPMTTLIVQIDEALAAKKPPASDQQMTQLIGDTHALLSPPRQPTDFSRRYFAAVQRDPGVAILHTRLLELWAA